jgi:hypothetical protein
MKLSHTKGSLTLEVVIASFIFLSISLGITNAFNTYLKGSNLSRPLTKASFLLDEGSEAVRALRDQSWTTFASSTSGTLYSVVWNSNTSVWNYALGTTTIDGKFGRSYTLADVNRDNTTKDIVTSGGTLDTNIKKITVNVAWKNGGATTTRHTSFYLANLIGN